MISETNRRPIHRVTCLCVATLFEGEAIFRCWLGLNAVQKIARWKKQEFSRKIIAHGTHAGHSIRTLQKCTSTALKDKPQGTRIFCRCWRLFKQPKRNPKCLCTALVKAEVVLRFQLKSMLKAWKASRAQSTKASAARKSEGATHWTP